MAEYIEREALILQFNLTAERSGDADCPLDMSAIETEIEAMPSADVVPVVRCKDCKWYGANPYDWENEDEMFCKFWIDYLPTNADDFCSYGERKEADGNG